MGKSVTETCFNVSGQTAIVTGASSGLGMLYAETLADLGANIVIAARRYDRLVKFADELTKKYAVKVVPVETDVTKEEQVIRMVQTAIDNFGSLEILVNNAGVASVLPSVSIPVEDWKKVVDTNLTGIFLCARTAAREMIKRKYGKIVNIASIYGATGDIFPAAPYYATKAAVMNLTRAFAVEWASNNISVNAIAPGFFPSEMTAPIFQDEAALKHIISRTPMGRLGKPEDLKPALVYLVCPSSNYVTGQTIFVDGGWTAL